MPSPAVHCDATNDHLNQLTNFRNVNAMVHSHSRTVIKVLSIRDAVIQSPQYRTRLPPYMTRDKLTSQLRAPVTCPPHPCACDNARDPHSNIGYHKITGGDSLGAHCPLQHNSAFREKRQMSLLDPKPTPTPD